MRNLLSFVLVLVVAVVATAAQDYCKLESCAQRNQLHTLCRFTNPNPSPKCNVVKKVGPTQQERDLIVKMHNDLRQFVAAGREKRGSNGPQPGATNMKTMTWDSELEKIAQRWANQCSFGHDACRNIAKYQVGQNVGIVATTGADNFTPANVIQAWYDEVSKFDKNQVSSLKNVKDVGHYTQMVWADSVKIGCGSVRYRDSNGWNSLYLVCNYGPTGNFMGQPVYKTR